MKLGWIAAAGLGLLLSGCISAAEQRALDEERCRGFGFRAGDAFAQCLLQLDLDRSATRRAQMMSDFGPWGGPYAGFGYGFRRW